MDFFFHNPRPPESPHESTQISRSYNWYQSLDFYVSHWSKTVSLSFSGSYFCLLLFCPSNSFVVTSFLDDFLFHFVKSGRIMAEYGRKVCNPDLVENVFLGSVWLHCLAVFWFLTEKGKRQKLRMQRLARVYTRPNQRLAQECILFAKSKRHAAKISLCLAVSPQKEKKEFYFVWANMICDGGLGCHAIKCVFGLNAIGLGLLYSIRKWLRTGLKIIELSKVLYTDDALFIGEWSRLNAKNLILILKCFENALGLKVNLTKSRLFEIGIPNNEVEEVAYSLGCMHDFLPFMYLGLPSSMGGLGVGSLLAKNLGLLGKWKWLTEKDALWRIVIKEFYGDSGGFRVGNDIIDFERSNLPTCSLVPPSDPLRLGVLIFFMFKFRVDQ
ncbi:reverse transcriptase domain, Zinc finger, CCHC-type [Artemisia annua]|uniref:Reverse transcriptase domain, Zinc finger, CCHC-type n=1 Tax=Artemisia annua TaxID=35608 RepID=A0A2U1MRP1_ARTAN|nr:reverse transcriptase domain, Zinc finger, CCHC-type [Artemisia annua]